MTLVGVTQTHMSPDHFDRRAQSRILSRACESLALQSVPRRSFYFLHVRPACRSRARWFARRLLRSL